MPSQPIREALIDPRLAKDIGLTEGDLQFECAAGFWTPLSRHSNGDMGRRCREHRGA